MRQVGAAAALLLVCCGSPTYFAPYASSIQVPEEVHPTVGSGFMSFSLPLRIHNEGGDTIVLVYCGDRPYVEIQRHAEDAGWVSWYVETCPLSEVMPVALPAGTEERVDVEIEASLHPEQVPHWGDGTLSGWYRVRLARQTGPRRSLEGEVFSTPFRVR